MVDLSVLSARLLDILFLGIALIGGLTIHECAHAWAADQRGDPTAKYLGRISLNPIRHLDPIGTIMLLVLIVAGVGLGWAKPVPVNPYNLKRGSRDYALISFAGPLANVILGLAFALILRVLTTLFPVPLFGGNTIQILFYTLLFVIAVVNFSLAVFNLIPIPPLDGFSVLLGILDSLPYRYRWARQVSALLRQYEPYGPFLLIVIIVMGTLGGFGFLSLLFYFVQELTIRISGF
ncbi:MAG: site-2 protease family protein [Chloroflexi bacterium]|nr:site-2 protease family protein [Chloroflexota bacterium]MBU1747668.1 site-2 protease family protein [Chloroflexota bacterium]